MRRPVPLPRCVIAAFFAPAVALLAAAAWADDPVGSLAVPAIPATPAVPATPATSATGKTLATTPTASAAAETATAAKAPMSPAEGAPRFTVETVRGRVVFFGEAMQRLAGVKCVDEARERTLALETADGQLLPLLEDVRGRGFRNDPRLRACDLELTVRRYRVSPFLQTLRVYSVEKTGKFELDYWCEVCAIAMYELKPCECCQGDTLFRRRLVRGE